MERLYDAQNSTWIWSRIIICRRARSLSHARDLARRPVLGVRTLQDLCGTSSTISVIVDLFPPRLMKVPLTPSVNYTKQDYLKHDIGKLIQHSDPQALSAPAARRSRLELSEVSISTFSLWTRVSAPCLSNSFMDHMPLSANPG